MNTGPADNEDYVDESDDFAHNKSKKKLNN